MKRSHARPGEVRIIGGEWRGRRLPVPAGPAVRPTGDRVRETLFNWLAPVIGGMRGLDLFAGTGALGLEALSRGAAAMCFVERDRAAARAIEESLHRLDCDRARVVAGDALQFLAGAPRAFDLVFLDPPFGEVAVGDLCKLLDGGWLSGNARIYLELPRAGSLPELPQGWRLLREKTAGHVRFALASGPLAHEQHAGDAGS
ncbi:MAG: 16S rRNA (guanine(966)-N(2))-methyltransferase RsmD [Gammaproteobacteria bacterium]|nr:MAG: 16S rRNA (guanine(966)-N(2))-methyltransferase RsmD [Gammaproteobacteria bacterium]